MQEQQKTTIVCDSEDPRRKTTFYIDYDDVVSILRKHLRDKKFEDDLQDAYEQGYVSTWDYWSEGEVR
jgi:hypothetical protein